MKEKLHIESLSNGLGAQSMLLFLMACRREIPATVSITADTGWEKDRKWSNGRRGPIKEYFDEIVVPMGEKYGIKTVFARAEDGKKQPLMDLVEHTKWCAVTGKLNNLKIPLFGSRKGRLMQACTDKWKIRAINQTLRKLGATTACTAQGIHSGEADRRVKGLWERVDGKWNIWRTTAPVTTKTPLGKVKTQKPIKWLTHYYPLVDLGFNRRDCQEAIVAEAIPYLLSSECDGCPHKDLIRWERTDPAVLQELAALEKQFNGEFFFTVERIPLLDAIAAMRAKRAANPEKYQVEADFGCGNAICGV